MIKIAEAVKEEEGFGDRLQLVNMSYTELPEIDFYEIFPQFETAARRKSKRRRNRRNVASEVLTQNQSFFDILLADLGYNMIQVENLSGLSYKSKKNEQNNIEYSLPLSAVFLVIFGSF